MKRSIEAVALAIGLSFAVPAFAADAPATGGDKPAEKAPAKKASKGKKAEKAHKEKKEGEKK